jgi:hypothetical protein
VIDIAPTLSSFTRSHDGVPTETETTILASINPVKLATLRRLSTDAMESSLDPGQPGSLKVRSDGTVIDGQHRLSILLERGEDIHQLPREIIERENHDP